MVCLAYTARTTSGDVRTARQIWRYTDSEQRGASHRMCAAVYKDSVFLRTRWTRTSLCCNVKHEGQWNCMLADVKRLLVVTNVLLLLLGIT